MPHSQKIKCSSQRVLQVCKFAKILKLGKYLFQGSKYGEVTQFPDFGISSNFLLKPLATFEIRYLLESWRLDYACHSDPSTMFEYKWPALFGMKYTKYLFPLLNKLPIFEYK
jgi:hypothetical protein